MNTSMKYLYGKDLAMQGEEEHSVKTLKATFQLLVFLFFVLYKERDMDFGLQQHGHREESQRRELLGCLYRQDLKFSPPEGR